MILFNATNEIFVENYEHLNKHRHYKHARHNEDDAYKKKRKLQGYLLNLAFFLFNFIINKTIKSKDLAIFLKKMNPLSIQLDSWIQYLQMGHNIVETMRGGSQQATRSAMHALNQQQLRALSLPKDLCTQWLTLA
jgi:hypothetical protein